MAGLGPLVPRGAHRAGLLMLATAVEFVAAMAIAQVGYPGYSDLSNAISDLGNSAKSPWFLVFNVGIVVFGLIGIGAAWFVRAGFRPKLVSRIGVALLAVTFAAAIGVGLFPEEINGRLHSLFASTAFLASGVALLMLAYAMLRDTRWDGYRLFTALCGAVVLLAIAVFTSPLTTPSIFGLVERLIVAPGLLWFAIAGLHLARMPVYDPSTAHAT